MGYDTAKETQNVLTDTYIKKLLYTELKARVPLIIFPNLALFLIGIPFLLIAIASSPEYPLPSTIPYLLGLSWIPSTLYSLYSHRLEAKWIKNGNYRIVVDYLLDKEETGGIRNRFGKFRIERHLFLVFQEGGKMKVTESSFWWQYSTPGEKFYCVLFPNHKIAFNKFVFCASRYRLPKQSM